MIDHKFDKDSEILYIYFRGDIYGEEIIDHISSINKIEGLPKELKLLYDLRQSSLKISSLEVKKISSIAESSLKNFPVIRSAFLVDKPLETALLSIFVDIKTRVTLNRKLFSTMEASLAWINL